MMLVMQKCWQSNLRKRSDGTVLSWLSCHLLFGRTLKTSLTSKLPNTSTLTDQT